MFDNAQKLRACCAYIDNGEWGVAYRLLRASGIDNNQVTE